MVVLSRATGALSWLAIPFPADPKARVDGLRSTGGVVAGTAYAITTKDTRDVVASLTADGQVAQVAEVVDPSSLTVDTVRGLLTWSAPSSQSTAWSSLVLAMPATGGVVTRLATFAQPMRTNRAAQVGRWSTDGRRLYLGEEPVGIGGYDGYFGDGVSSLLVLDAETGRMTRLVPFTTGGLCLDDLSPGQRRLVDTCRRAVRVRDLTTGATTVISTPAGSSAYRRLRSARFSPDGSRVAYALLKANPDAEQGAVAVSDSLRGSSHLVATFARSTVSVDGWITSTTLLVESMQVTGCAGWCTSTWLVDVASGRRTRLTTGDATIVAIDPGRPGG